MKVVTSTMAGVVFKVLARPGDTVKEGQEVIILESMKMEIPIVSEQTGTVRSVAVKAGDFVNEGDGLLVLE